MKTHELAKQLAETSKALRLLPNVEISQLGKATEQAGRIDKASIPVALSTLVALSDVDKRQWLLFIEENLFPIDVRPRDAARDILGKLLKFLEQNPEARNKLRNVAQKERTSTAPELKRALDILLNS